MYASRMVSHWLSRDPLGEYMGVNLYEYVEDDPVNATDEFGLKTCQGSARVIGPNDKMGRSGGWSGNKIIYITPNTAAIDPAQWGGKAAVRPFLGDISGKFIDNHGAVVGSFKGITDVIGPPSARDKLKRINPHTLIIERPDGQDLGVINVILTVPNGFNCPDGTQ